TSDVTLRAGRELAARSFRIDAPTDLLDYYTPDGFVWFGGNRGFVASGVAAVVAPADAVAFLAAVDHVATDDRVSRRAGPRAMGALPFAGPGELVVPALIIGRDANGETWRTEIDHVEAPPIVH